MPGTTTAVLASVIVVWIETWGHMIATFVLVVVTACYVMLVNRQLRQSEKDTLLHNRYQGESEITQLRIKRAEFLDKAGKRTRNGKTSMDIINEREEQCKITIDRIVEELEKL